MSRKKKDDWEPDPEICQLIADYLNRAGIPKPFKKSRERGGRKPGIKRQPGKRGK